MCGWRDGYCWKAKGRRESGEDKREFEQLLKLVVKLLDKRFDVRSHVVRSDIKTLSLLIQHRAAAMRRQPYFFRAI